MCSALYQILPSTMKVGKSLHYKSDDKQVRKLQGSDWRKVSGEEPQGGPYALYNPLKEAYGEIGVDIFSSKLQNKKNYLQVSPEEV